MENIQKCLFLLVLATAFAFAAFGPVSSGALTCKFGWPQAMPSCPGSSCSMEMNTQLVFTYGIRVAAPSVQILYLNGTATDLGEGTVICPGTIDVIRPATGTFASSAYSSNSSYYVSSAAQWTTCPPVTPVPPVSTNRPVSWNAPLFTALLTPATLYPASPNYNNIPAGATEPNTYYPFSADPTNAQGSAEVAMVCNGSEVISVGALSSGTIYPESTPTWTTPALAVGDYPISGQMTSDCGGVITMRPSCSTQINKYIYDRVSGLPNTLSLNAFTLYVRNPTVLAVQFFAMAPPPPYYFIPNEQRNVSVYVINPVASGVSVNATGATMTGGYTFTPTSGFDTLIAPDGTVAELNGTITAPATITPGTVTLNINFVANEVNCAGNLMNMTLPIALVTNASSDSVDLIPEIRFNNTTPGVGDSVLVTYRTRNNGTLTANPASNTTYGGPEISGWYAVRVLGPGDSESESAVFVCPRVGLFTFNETVDSDDNVTEYPDPPAEGNNYGEENLYCGTGNWTYNINCTYYV